jgi:hypothetical protein
MTGTAAWPAAPGTAGPGTATSGVGAALTATPGADGGGGMTPMLRDLAIAFFALLGLGAIGVVITAVIAYRHAVRADHQGV